MAGKLEFPIAAASAYVSCGSCGVAVEEGGDAVCGGGGCGGSCGIGGGCSFGVGGTQIMTGYDGVLSGIVGGKVDDGGGGGVGGVGEVGGDTVPSI